MYLSAFWLKVRNLKKFDSRFWPKKGEIKKWRAKKIKMGVDD